MRLQYLPYLWPLLASAGLTAGLALIAARHRIVRGAPAFAMSMSLMTIWFSADFFIASGKDLAANLIWLNIAYFAITLIPFTWLWMTLQLTGGERWLTRGFILSLLVVPAITNILLWVDPSLMRRNVALVLTGPFPMLRMTFGPWFWVHAAYSYLLNFTSLFLQGKALKTRVPLYRRQISALFIALFLVTIANFLNITGIVQTGFDLTPLGICLGSLIVAWCLLRYRLFDVVPIARATVVDRMSGAVIVLDAWCRILDLNPAAEALLDCSVSQAAGRPCEEVVHDWPALVEACHDPRMTHGEFVREGTERRWYDVHFSGLRDRRGRSLGRVVVVHDITEGKKAQAELDAKQQALGVLEEREHLARELHDSLGQVLGYINVQAQAIREMLISGRAAALEEPLARMIAATQEAQTNVREFIHDIRTTSRFEHGFKHTLHQYLAQFQAGCGITAVINDRAELDRLPLEPTAQVQLFRILQETLTNIRKHARAKSVEVSFVLELDLLRICVADDGTGFAPGEVGRTGGTSFGLGIMHERAAQIGARLRIDSAPGRGTRVEIEVPLTAEKKTDRSGKTTTIRRILLVDDHVLFREGLKNLLETRGYQVVGLAGDGRDAVVKARALQPEIVLMDIQMPNCDGLTATRLIKAEMPEVKIVMLTMSEGEDDLFESVKSGASGYLLKNLSAEELFSLLDDLAKGEAPLSPGLAVKILHEFARLKETAVNARPDPGKPETGLTPRQIEVLTAVARGMTYKEIGAAIHLSERTIKYHMGEILAQLHLSNRREVLAYARKAGIIPGV